MYDFGEKRSDISIADFGLWIADHGSRGRSPHPRWVMYDFSGKLGTFGKFEI